MPPIIVTANGIRISKPSLKSKAMGKSANTVVTVVIKIGRQRIRAAFFMASSLLTPCFWS